MSRLGAACEIACADLGRMLPLPGVAPVLRFSLSPCEASRKHPDLQPVRNVRVEPVDGLDSIVKDGDSLSWLERALHASVSASLFILLHRERTYQQGRILGPFHAGRGDSNTK